MVDLAGFGLSAAINSAIAVVILSIFLYCRSRPFNHYVYQPRLLHPAFRQGRAPPPPLPDTWFNWMVTVYHVDKEQLLSCAGLDAYMFIRFLELCVVMFAAMTILGVGVLVPVNYTGNNGQDQFEAISMSNIAENSPRLAAHVIVSWCFAAWMYYVLTKVWMEYHELRLAFMAEENLQNRGMTLLVQNVPESARTDKQFINTFRSFFPMIDANHPQEAVPMLSPTHSNSLDGYSAHDQNSPPQLIHSAFLAKDIGPLDDTIADRDAALANLEHALAAYKEKPEKRPMAATKYFCCDKQDAINYYTEELHKNCALISEKRAESLPYYTNGFVTFESVLAYQSAAFVDKDSEPFGWDCKPAPELRDVYWPSLSFTEFKRTYMCIIMGVLLWALVFLWIFPITFIQGVANLSQLPDKISAFSFINDIPAGVLAIIDGFLPGLILTLFNIFLPAILLLFTKLEGVEAFSWQQQAVLSKFFIFQVVNNFFFTTASTAILNQLTAIIDDPTSIVTFLGTSIPATATFFITYMLFVTLSAYPMQLLNPGGVIVGWIKKKFLVKTPRDLIAVEQATAANYGTTYPINLFSFIIAACFACISPIILPFAVLYFAAGVFVNKYQMLYANNQLFETGGQFWPVVSGRIVTCLIVAQAVFTALLGIKKSIGAAVASAPLIIAPLIWQYYIERAYLRKSQVLPLAAAVQVDREREKRRRLQPGKTTFLDEAGKAQDYGYNQAEFRSIGYAHNETTNPHEHITAEQAEKVFQTQQKKENDELQQQMMIQIQHREEQKAATQAQQQTHKQTQQQRNTQNNNNTERDNNSKTQTNNSKTSTPTPDVDGDPNNAAAGSANHPVIPTSSSSTSTIASSTRPQSLSELPNSPNSYHSRHARLQAVLNAGYELGALPPPIDYIQPALLAPETIPIPTTIRIVKGTVDTVEKDPTLWDEIQPAALQQHALSEGQQTGQQRAQEHGQDAHGQTHTGQSQTRQSLSQTKADEAV